MHVKSLQEMSRKARQGNTTQQKDKQHNTTLPGTVFFKAKLAASGGHEPISIDLLSCKRILILNDYCVCTMYSFIHKLRVSCLVQLDMELEAHNLRRFQQNMGDNYCVKFPTPLFPFVTKRVLVETFEVCTYSSLNTLCS